MSSLFQWLVTLQEWKWLPLGRNWHLAMGRWKSYLWRTICQEPGSKQFSVKIYSSPPQCQLLSQWRYTFGSAGHKQQHNCLLSTPLTSRALGTAQPVLEFKLKHSASLVPHAGVSSVDRHEPHEPKRTAGWCRHEFSASTKEEGAISSVLALRRNSWNHLMVFFFFTKKISLL